MKSNLLIKSFRAYIEECNLEFVHLIIPYPILITIKFFLVGCQKIFRAEGMFSYLFDQPPDMTIK